MNMMDFSNMPFDPSKKGILIENYPELAEYPEFKDKKNDILLKLAFSITDQNSPFVIKYKNYTGIVTAACDYFGCSDKLLSELVMCAVTDDTSRIMQMQSRYFILFNNWEYQTFWDLMFRYHENSLVIRTPLNPADKDYERKSELKGKIGNSQMELQKNLVSYENQIFPNNTNLKKVITIHTAKIINWPERMAKDYSSPE